MLELLQTLSDDQTALFGCGIAFLGATALLMMSYHANPNNKNKQLVDREAQTAPQKKSEDEQEHRRAA